MTLEQADLLEAWLAALPGVERATVRERTNGVTILYHGSEKALRSALAGFSFAGAERTMPPLPHSSRAMISWALATTGRGTPTGNAIVPVLKVTANARTFRMMDDNMDVDLSPIISGEKTYREMGRELLDVMLGVCNGRLTKAEAYGFSDIAVDHVCRFV